MSVLKVESTKAKSGFAGLPAKARASDLAITRHGRVQAYVLSPDRYQSLVGIAEVGKDSLRELEDEFATLVARMQSAGHGQAVRALETLSLSEVLAAGSSRSKPRKAAKNKSVRAATA